jgi:hypothetical protein
MIVPIRRRNTNSVQVRLDTGPSSNQSRGRTRSTDLIPDGSSAAWILQPAEPSTSSSMLDITAWR